MSLQNDGKRPWIFKFVSHVNCKSTSIGRKKRERFARNSFAPPLVIAYACVPAGGLRHFTISKGIGTVISFEVGAICCVFDVLSNCRFSILQVAGISAQKERETIFFFLKGAISLM